MNRIVSWHRVGMGWAMCFTSLCRAQQAPAPEEDIREARGLIEIPAAPEPSYAIWWIAAAALVAIALAWLAVHLLKSRQEAASPLGLAMKHLREIEQRQQQWDDERYAIEVADALRTYVVAAHGIAAPQRTSQEFLQECAHRKVWRDDSLETLRALLRSCDVAKFASGALTALHRADMLSQVRELVLVPVKKEEENSGESAA